MNKWERIYKEQGDFFKEPNIETIKAIRFLKNEGLKKILDLGCGTGRHTKLMKDEGFDVYGCDMSLEGVRITREKVPGCDIRICDMKNLPYEDSFFDGILSINVIEHGTSDEVKTAISEAFRVLRKKGVIVVKVISTEHWKFETGEEVEPFTKRDTDGVDVDTHHFFTEKSMREFFRDFDIINLYLVRNESETDAGKEAAGWILYARKP